MQRHSVRLKLHLRHLTNDNLLIASSLRLPQVALQPLLSHISSDQFSISEYRRQLDHMGLKAAAMKKLILVYRYVQISPCCIYCLVEEGVLIDEYGLRFHPWNIYVKKTKRGSKGF